jgi:subtilase family serine protease
MVGGRMQPTVDFKHGGFAFGWTFGWDYIFLGVRSLLSSGCSSQGGNSYIAPYPSYQAFSHQLPRRRRHSFPSIIDSLHQIQIVPLSIYVRVSTIHLI